VTTRITGPRRRALLLAGCAGLVVALVVTLVVVLTRGTSSRPAGKVVGAAPPKQTAPRVAPTPSPTHSARPHKKRVPHEFVAAAAPTRFVYRAPGWTIRASVCGMEYVRPLDPPGEQHHTVCWVQHDFGFAPGSKGEGTTYVLGHSWAEDPLEVLNHISTTAMREVLPEISHHRVRLVSNVATYPIRHLNGDVISLRTPSGLLRYTVRSAFAVAKSEAGYVQPLMAEHTRHRVVIITCGELNGVDYDYNIVVNAYLTSSKAAPART
jgi:hypothetical protein